MVLSVRILSKCNQRRKVSMLQAKEAEELGKEEDEKVIKKWTIFLVVIMILFKEEHVEKILSGKKTETRRLWSKPHANVGSLHKAKTKMLSKEYFALLRIVDVYQERLGDITEEGVKAEGYSSLEEYKSVLEKINKKSKFLWDDDQLVYVIKFKVVE